MCINLKYLLLIILSLFFTACSHKYELIVDKQYAVEKDVDNGLVIVSFTASGLENIPFILSYRGAQESNKHIFGHIPIIGEYDWELSRKKTVTAKDNYKGRLIVLKLPAGSYQFYSMNIDDGYQDAEWLGGGGLSLPFKSSLSAIEYAGNVHVWSRHKGVDSDVTYNIYDGDERIRDIALFRKKYQLDGNIAYSVFSPP